MTYIHPLRERGLACPMTACRWHLLTDSHRSEMDPAASCALDLADAGGSTLQEIGEALGVSRERVRQIEAMALRKWRREARRSAELRDWLEDMGLEDWLFRPVRAIKDYPEGWR